MVDIMKKSINSTYCRRNFEYYLLKPANDVQVADLLYVQDGGDYLELGEFEKTFKDLSKKYPEQAKSLICVLISPGTSEERWHSYNQKGKHFNDYISFFTEELMPEVETELNTKIRKRGLLGESLGGNISVNIAMHNPDKWSHLLLQSSAVSEEDLAELKLKDQLHWNIYQTVGVYEDEFISTISKERLYIYTRNQEMYQIFRDKQANIEYIEQEESHLWDFWRRNLLDALQYFVRNP